MPEPVTLTGAQQIDRHMLAFTIRGTFTEITQGPFAAPAS